MDIEQLNFSVIVDDKDFDKQVSKIESRAKTFNTNVSKYLELELKLKGGSLSTIISGLDEIKDHAKGVSPILDQIADKIRNMPKAQTIFDVNSLEHALDELEDGLGPNSPAVQGLTQMEDLSKKITQLTGIAFGAAGLRAFVKELIDVTGEFEVQKMALASMIKDGNKAEQIFEQLKQNALESPYTFQDLAKYAKQLAAFNIPVDNIVETERRLADVAAGLGQDLGRIILAYGQVRAAGVLKGTELRQFTEAGVPILEHLAKQIQETEGHAVSLAEVFKRISRKQIPFAMVEEAFRRMTSEGGQFYKMQEVLVETLQGKIGKLRDTWQQMLYSVGGSSDVLKKSVDAITSVVANLDKFSGLIETILIGFGAYVSILSVVAAAQQLVFGAQALMRIAETVKQIKELTTVTERFAAASKLASPVSLALAAVATAGYLAYRSIRQVNEELKVAQKTINDYKGSVEAEKAAAKGLLTEMEKLKAGTAEYEILKNRLLDKYGEYLTNVDKEKIAVGNLAGVYDDLAVSIENAAKQRFLDKGMEDIEGVYAKQLSSLMDQLERTFKYGAGDAGVSVEVKDEVRKYITGEVAELSAAAKTFESQVNSTLSEMDRGLAGGAPVSKLSTLREEFQKIKGDTDEARKALLAFFAALGGSTTTGGGNDDPKLTPPTDLPVIDIDKMMEEVDKELLAMIAENTKELDAELDKRFKAMNDWDAFMDKWEHTRGVKEGEGAAFRLSGYISDFRKEDYANLEEYRKQLNNLRLQFDENSAAYKEGKKKLDAWKASVDDSARNRLKERARGLADDIIKEGLVGFDLTNWSDKNISQIEQIRETLQKLELPESFRKQLKDDDELLKIIIDELNRLKQEKIDNTIDPERWKKVSKQVKYIAKQFMSVADSLKRYADATGDNGLSVSIEAMGRVAQNIQAAEEGAKAWGGWWGAIIGGVTDLISQVTDGLADAENEANAFHNSLIDIRSELRKTAFNENLSSGVDAIFGENSVDNVRGAIKNMEDALDLYKKGFLEAQRSAEYKKYLQYSQSRPLEEVERMAELLTKDKLYEYAQNIQVKKVGLFTENHYKSLADIAKELDISLYDDNGFLNPVLLDKVITLYGDLNKDFLESLKNSKDAAEAYKNAIDEINKVLESLIGSVASDAADKIVDSWVEAGNAALDYADILDEVAKAYAKMLIQDTIMKTYLDPITEDLSKSFIEGRYEDAMAMIAGAMQGISDSAPMFENILKAFDPYFTGSSTDGSLGSGIKSITEETASLLASYINAMRADLSYMRGLQEKGWGTVELMGQAVPTLNEYMAQVAANTDRSAQNTQSILEELRSVIGAPDSSGSIMRVQMA